MLDHNMRIPIRRSLGLNTAMILKQFALRGLVAAPFTPFAPDGALDLAKIPDYAQLLHAQGVRGAFVAGTTGEGASMTTAERKQVAEAWRQAAPPALKVVVHVGHTAVAESEELARHAQRIGADAFAAFAPPFFKPAGIPALVETCARIASAAPKLPFYYYHIPSMTGFNCRVAEFLVAAGSRIPNLCGVKFTHEDVNDLGLCLQTDGGRFDILQGRDDALLGGFAIGCRGAVGSTYNNAGRLFCKLLADFEQGNLPAARLAQYRAQQMIGALLRYGGGIVGGKAMMRMCGFPVGPVRLPLVDISQVLCSEFEAELRAQDFFRHAGWE